MTINVDAQSEITKHLLALPGIPEVSLPGIKYSPRHGTPWLRLTIAPASTDASSIGIDGYNLTVGLIRLDLFYPNGKGLGDALAMADTLSAHFKRGTNLDAAGLNIRIERVYTLEAVEEPDWMQVPVRVDYFVYSSN
jgi:hypothetical protein